MIAILYSGPLRGKCIEVSDNFLSPYLKIPLCEKDKLGNRIIRVAIYSRQYKYYYNEFTFFFDKFDDDKYPYTYCENGTTYMISCIYAKKI